MPSIGSLGHVEYSSSPPELESLTYLHAKKTHIYTFVVITRQQYISLLIFSPSLERGPSVLSFFKNFSIFVGK